MLLDPFVDISRGEIPLFLEKVPERRSYISQILNLNLERGSKIKMV